jgi:hypothetical protein
MSPNANNWNGNCQPWPDQSYLTDKEHIHKEKAAVRKPHGGGWDSFLPITSLTTLAFVFAVRISKRKGRGTRSNLYFGSDPRIPLDRQWIRRSGVGVGEIQLVKLSIPELARRE